MCANASSRARCCQSLCSLSFPQKSHADLRTCPTLVSTAQPVLPGIKCLERPCQADVRRVLIGRVPTSIGASYHGVMSPLSVRRGFQLEFSMVPWRTTATIHVEMHQIATVVSTGIIGALTIRTAATLSGFTRMRSAIACFMGHCYRKQPTACIP